MQRYVYLITIISYLVYLIANSFSHNKSLILRFIDVNQGDATLLSYKNEYMLIDGGPSYVIDYNVYKLNPTKCLINHVILTHPHKDHLFGLLRILPRCNVSNIFHNAIDHSYKQYNVWLKDITPRYLTKGNVIWLGEVALHILWPPDKYKSPNINNSSIVILVDYKDFEALLMADAEVLAIKQIEIEKYLHLIQNGLDVYKVSHQGSIDGLDRDFLLLLQPKIAVISVGKNKYGHPSDEVLKYLESIGSQIYRTDLSGNIKVVVK